MPDWTRLQNAPKPEHDIGKRQLGPRDAPADGPQEHVGESKPKRRVGGREPFAETKVLLALMKEHLRRGGLKPAAEYQKWFLSEFPGIGANVARQRIKRARRKLLGDPPTRLPPGRPPKSSTLALRAKLEADAAAGSVGPVSEYIPWLLAEEPGLKEGTARQRVQNERRRILQRNPGLVARRRAAQGRKVKGSTLALRERLEADAVAGRVGTIDDYVRFLVGEEPGLKETTARQRVRKELRALPGNPAGLKRRRVRRRASPALGAVREKIRQDAEGGRLAEKEEYVRFAMERDGRLGLKRARTIVAREWRSAAT